MSINQRKHGIFVCHHGSLTPAGGGGVQLCTREYFDTLAEAGFDLEPVEVENDRRIWTRIRRRLAPNPYRNALVVRKAIADLREKIHPETSHVFLNQATMRPLAPAVKREFGKQIRVVVLSHGLRSVDFFHEVRARTSANPSRRELVSLAGQLFDENAHAECIDHVFCVAPFEIQIEKWLGARSASFVPRTIRHSVLNWKPEVGRIGYVGTLDHPPNEEGLALFLRGLPEAISKQMELRLVGGPRPAGDALAGRFAHVRYLGPLSDEELAAEASTWSCFIHPVFCYAMGVSTKLAVAIGWGIPIVTTSMGCRGYIWEEGELRLADEPTEFAKRTAELLDLEEAQRVHNQVMLVRQSSPSMPDVAQQVRHALDELNHKERIQPRLAATSSNV